MQVFLFPDYFCSMKNSRSICGRFAFTLLLVFIFTDLSAGIFPDECLRPMGFATAVSRTDSGAYALTGGGTGKKIVLKSNGKDMREAIMQALEHYDVVVLDGSNGPFVVSQSIGMNGLRNKTLAGVNKATLETEFYISDAIRQMLDSAHVNDLSTDGNGGVLPNGMRVGEQREFRIRQLLYELYQDSLETYRMGGILSIRNCENIIVRNLRLVGPGAIDIGGSDLISCVRTCHLWVDHCDLTDGMDGNFDITQQSDFISVTWCHFHYTGRSYDHCYSNLISASDRQVADSGKLNTTFAYCVWGEGCEQRMPMARFGKVHVLSCYYTCRDAVRCINPRKESEFLVESCMASAPITHWLVDGGSRACHERLNIIPMARRAVNHGRPVTVPYVYTALPAARLSVLLSPFAGAGATLKDPLLQICK